MSLSSHFAFPGAERSLEALLEATPNAVVMIDARGSIRYCNRSTNRLFGYELHELVGNNVSILMPEPERSEHAGYLDHYLRTGEARVIGIGREASGQRKDGSRFHLHLAVGRVETADEPVFIGIISDISARVESEEALRRQRDIQEVVLLAINSFLRRESEQEISVQLSRALLKATNSKYALIGELMMADDGGELLCTLPLPAEHTPAWSFAVHNAEGCLEFSRLDNPFAFPVFTGTPLLTNEPEGHPAWLGISPQASGIHNFLAIPIWMHNIVIGVFAVANCSDGYAEDLVEYLRPVQDTLAAVLYARRVRREAEQRLVQQERAARRMQAIVETAPVGVAVVDAQGIYETVNPAYCRIYEYSADEMIGQRFTMVFEPEAREDILALHQRFVAEGGEFSGPWTVVTRSGNQRYIVKDSVRIQGDDGAYRRLVFVTDVTEHMLMQNELRRTNDLLREQADYDGLTEIYNHRHILEVFDTEYKRLQRKGLPLCIALLDLDHFKHVNDQYGHLTGDEVLHAVAAALKQGIREIDAVGRYGGEEFLVLLPDTELDVAISVIDRLRVQVEALGFSVPGLRVSFSAGVTRVRQEENVGDALSRVDGQLYAAKRDGRGRSSAGG